MAKQFIQTNVYDQATTQIQLYLNRNITFYNNILNIYPHVVLMLSMLNTNYTLSGLSPF